METKRAMTFDVCAMKASAFMMMVCVCMRG